MPVCPECSVAWDCDTPQGRAVQQHGKCLNCLPLMPSYVVSPERFELVGELCQRGLLFELAEQSDVELTLQMGDQLQLRVLRCGHEAHLLGDSATCSHCHRSEGRSLAAWILELMLLAQLTATCRAAQVRYFKGAVGARHDHLVQARLLEQELDQQLRCLELLEREQPQQTLFAKPKF